MYMYIVVQPPSCQLYQSVIYIFQNIYRGFQPWSPLLNPCIYCYDARPLLNVRIYPWVYFTGICPCHSFFNSQLMVLKYSNAGMLARISFDRLLQLLHLAERSLMHNDIRGKWLSRMLWGTLQMSVKCDCGEYTLLFDFTFVVTLSLVHEFLRT